MAVANTSVLGGRRQGMLGRTGNSAAGMLGSTPAPYAAPAPKGAAGEQAQANVWAANETANINRVNQTNPFGSQTFTKPTEPGGQWSSTTTLNPAEQANLDRQRGLTGSILDMGQKRVGMLGNGGPLEFGAPAPVAADYNGPNSATTDALYGAYTSRLDPQWQREQESLRTRLANQGVNVGSEAYANEQDIFGKNKNDAYTQALANAVGMGVTENSNAFNRALSARQQGVDEAVLQRNQPLNELQALLGLAPGVNTPTFNNAPAVNINSPDTQAEDRLKAQQEQIAQQQEQATRSANLGAAAGLGGAALSAFGPSIAKGISNAGGIVPALKGLFGGGGATLANPFAEAGGITLGSIPQGAALSAGTSGAAGSGSLAGGAGADTLAGAGGGGLSSFLAGPGGAAAALALPFIAGPALQKGIDAVFGDGQYSPAQAQENREEQAQGLSRILNGAPVQRTTVPNPAMYSMSPERFAESGLPETVEIIIEPVTGAQFTPEQIQQAMAAMAPQNLERMPRMVR
jgi:hypothetical protein